MDKLILPLMVTIIALSAFASTFILPTPVKIEPTPCNPTGVTLIEYGVGITSCGDTVLIKMPGDLYKEYQLKNKIKQQ